MIYNIYKNNGKGIGFSEAKSNETNLKAYCECIKVGLKTFFVPEGAKMETIAQSEPEASSSKAKITSKPKNLKPKVVVNSESKTAKIKILKRSKPVPQSLMKSESDVLKSKVQKGKTVVASEVSKPKVEKSKVLIKKKLPKAHLKEHGMESKTFNTNPKGPIKQWVPKSEIVNTADLSKSKIKAKVIVPGQRFLKAHDRREVNFPIPHNERRRKCKVWRQPVWEVYWYGDYW